MIVRLAFLLVLSFGATGATAAEPFARAEILSKGPIIAGQRIDIAVDLFVPNFFKSAPAFPTFELDKALVALPESRAVNLVETFDGIQYSGIRRSYEIIPQAAGRYRLPDIRITLAYAGNDGELLKTTVSVPPIGFAAGPVPGDWQGQQPFVAKDVTIVQTLDRDPAKLKTGDAIIREITITAEDTRAMMIPALELHSVAGTRLYRQDPVLDDAVATEDRGDASRRVERLTYLAEKSGDFVLPSVELKWLDPADGRSEIAAAPAVKLVVDSAPVSKAIIPPVTEDTTSREAREKEINRYLYKILLLAAEAVLAFAVLWHFTGWVKAFIRGMKQRYRQSERHYFRVARRALSGDEPLAALSALDQWTRKLGFQSTDAWARSSGEADIQRHVAALQRAIFGRPDVNAPEPPYQEIAILMTRARWQPRAPLYRPLRAKSRLPPLNP